MVNPFKEVNWRPNHGETRKFALSLMIGFPVLALVFFLGKGITAGTWNGSFPLLLAGLGAGAGGVFWLIPQIARPFYIAWYFLACCIGIVVANLSLALLYYLIVTPTGLALRLAGRSPIRKRPDRTSRSY
jgi:hypothetical protein